jgi:hypothetical protein
MKRSAVMPKENTLTDQRELIAEELELVSGGVLPSIMERIFETYAKTVSSGSPTCPDYVCGTQH